MLIRIDPQEAATIAAALRFYAKGGQGEPENRSDLIHELATAGDKVISLDNTAVRKLEARIRDEDLKVRIVIARDSSAEEGVRVLVSAGVAAEAEILDLNDPDTGRCDDKARFEQMRNGDPSCFIEIIS